MRSYRCFYAGRCRFGRTGPSNALDVHRIRTKTEWDGPRKETRVPPAAWRGIAFCKKRAAGTPLRPGRGQNVGHSKKFGGSQTLRTDRIRIYKKYGMSKGYWFYRWAYELIKFLAG